MQIRFWYQNYTKKKPNVLALIWHQFEAFIIKTDRAMKDVSLNGDISNVKNGCHGNHSITYSQGEVSKWQPAYFHTGRFMLSDKSGCHLVLRKSPLSYIFQICLPTTHLDTIIEIWLWSVKTLLKMKHFALEEQMLHFPKKFSNPFKWKIL